MNFNNFICQLEKQQPHLQFSNSLRCPEEALQRLQATELLPCILFAQIVPGNFAQPAVQYHIFLTRLLSVIKSSKHRFTIVLQSQHRPKKNNCMVHYKLQGKRKSNCSPWSRFMVQSSTEHTLIKIKHKLRTIDKLVPKYWLLTTTGLFTNLYRWN